MKKTFLTVIFILFAFSGLFAVANDKLLSNTLVKQSTEKAWDGKFDEALNDLDIIIKKDKKCAGAYYAKAGMLLIKGDYQQSIENYKKVQKLDPQHKDDAAFFMQLAQRALENPDAEPNFNLYNVSLILGEGEPIKLSKKERKLINKVLYSQLFFDTHLEALEIFCKDSGYHPQKYFDLLSVYKKSNSRSLLNEKDKLYEKMDYERRKMVDDVAYVYINKTSQDYLKSAVRVHQKDFEDLKIKAQADNYNFTKAQYCKYFDEEAEKLIKLKMSRF